MAWNALVKFLASRAAGGDHTTRSDRADILTRGSSQGPAVEAPNIGGRITNRGRQQVEQDAVLDMQPQGQQAEQQPGQGMYGFTAEGDAPKDIVSNPLQSGGNDGFINMLLQKGKSVRTGAGAAMFGTGAGKGMVMGEGYDTKTNSIPAEDLTADPEADSFAANTEGGGWDFKKLANSRYPGSFNGEGGFSPKGYFQKKYYDPYFSKENGVFNFTQNGPWRR